MRKSEEVKEVKDVADEMDKSARIAAFFDLDGTLMPLPSLERRFFRMLRKRHEIPLKNYFLWLGEALQLLPRGITALAHTNKMYLKGLQTFDELRTENCLHSLVRENGLEDGGQASRPPNCNPRSPVPRFFEQGVERVTCHAMLGHRVVIMSGTLEPLGNAAACALEAEIAARGFAVRIRTCATRLRETNGKWTGEIIGEPIWGEAKARVVSALAEEMGLDLSQCWAYGNSSEDRWMLAAVGNPVAMNPAFPLEWIALGYLGFSSMLVALFAENLAHPVRLVSTQALVAAMILLLCRAGGRARKLPNSVDLAFSAKFWHFWRHWYPHLFLIFCFEELGSLVHLVDPGWEDAKLMAFDRWLTGVNPPLWFEHLVHPALTEFMEFSYFTYFVYLLILGGVLYFEHDREAYWSAMTYSVIGYVFGYVIAMLFPAESPYFTLAGQWHRALTGGPFTGLVMLIEKYGRVHGAAFPSQHVAGAMAALWGAWRHRRWLFWIFLPFVACMCVSTVYVRNHYMADVLGGLVTGTLGYFLGCRLMKLDRARERAADRATTRGGH